MNKPYPKLLNIITCQWLSVNMEAGSEALGHPSLKAS